MNKRGIKRKHFQKYKYHTTKNKLYTYKYIGTRIYGMYKCMHRCKPHATHTVSINKTSVVSNTAAKTWRHHLMPKRNRITIPADVAVAVDVAAVGVIDCYCCCCFCFCFRCRCH